MKTSEYLHLSDTTRKRLLDTGWLALLVISLVVVAVEERSEVVYQAVLVIICSLVWGGIRLVMLVKEINQCRCDAKAQTVSQCVHIDRKILTVSFIRDGVMIGAACAEVGEARPEFEVSVKSEGDPWPMTFKTRDLAQAEQWVVRTLVEYERLQKHAPGAVTSKTSDTAPPAEPYEMLPPTEAPWDTQSR